MKKNRTILSIYTVLLLGFGLTAAALTPASVCAHDCTTEDKNGDERQCTHWEEFMVCRAAAQDAFEQCREAGGSYIGCDIPRGFSMLACDVDFVGGLLWPFD